MQVVLGPSAKELCGSCDTEYESAASEKAEFERMLPQLSMSARIESRIECRGFSESSLH